VVQKQREENIPKLCNITGFRHEADENCTLLGYYAASSGRFLTLEDGTRYAVPKRRYGITTTRCIITQKRAVLLPKLH